MRDTAIQGLLQAQQLMQAILDTEVKNPLFRAFEVKYCNYDDGDEDDNEEFQGREEHLELAVTLKAQHSLLDCLPENYRLVRKYPDNHFHFCDVMGSWCHCKKRTPPKEKRVRRARPRVSKDRPKKNKGKRQ
ncbi:MAG: hypothetical protein Q8R55_06850 [Candidatus Taylorbacteria bacterium]|nr:hypothetical protein [Candidatus Taylorbacteria bacterium]